MFRRVYEGEGVIYVDIWGYGGCKEFGWGIVNRLACWNEVIEVKVRDGFDVRYIGRSVI